MLIGRDLVAAWWAFSTVGMSAAAGAVISEPSRNVSVVDRLPDDHPIGVGAIVTPVAIERPKNLSDPTLSTFVVDYPPGASAVLHRMPSSGYVLVHVSSGTIRAAAWRAGVGIYHAGQTWLEPAFASSIASVNPSEHDSARALVILVTGPQGPTTRTSPPTKPKVTNAGTSERARYKVDHNNAPPTELGDSGIEARPQGLRVVSVRDLTKDILWHCGIERGMRVLELGCGTGDASLWIARLVGHTGPVVGIDDSAKAIEVTERQATVSGRCYWTRFVTANPVTFVPHQRFDAVIVRLTLLRQGERASFQRLSACVRPGGAVVVVSGKPAAKSIRLPSLLGSTWLAVSLRRQGSASSDDNTTAMVDDFPQRERANQRACDIDPLLLVADDIGVVSRKPPLRAKG